MISGAIVLKLFRSDRAGCAAFALIFVAYCLRRLWWLQSEAHEYPGATWDVIGILMASFVLLSSLFAIRARPHEALRAGLVGGPLGVIFFVATLGVELANPTNVDWLMRGDWAQHFLGWHFFRNSPWMWPVGAFDSFWHPIGTSVVYTDSLPLVAVPLKLLSPVLPARFQYIGLWILFNCTMQGVFGALLLRCFTPRISLQAIGAAFLLITPIFLSRVAHDTLTTQWLLLASLWMYFREDDARRVLVPWIALGTISALVHPYLCVMVLALMFAYYWRALSLCTLGWKTIVAHILIVISAVLSCWWVSGTFIIKIRSGFEAGVNSANLLTWFNAESFSRWLPMLPQVGDGQFEGVGYLGLGVLILCALSLPLLLRAPNHENSRRVVLTPLIVVVAAMSLFAFSTRLTFGDVVLADFTPKHLQMIGALRASGRFIWPSVYLITLFPLVTIAHRAARVAFPILAVVFFIQLLDLAPLQIFHAHMRQGEFGREHEQVLKDDYWKTAIIGKQHIVLLPALDCGDEVAPYFPFSLLAADNGMTVNTAYLARYDGIRRAKYCEDSQKEIASGARDGTNLYIVRSDLLDQFKATSRVPVDCHQADGYWACTAK